jgi:hypothetical protein
MRDDKEYGYCLRPGDFDAIRDIDEDQIENAVDDFLNGDDEE